MRWIGLITTLLLAVVAAADDAPKIELGHDTTRITAPLKADGTPDYLKYINDRAKEGVTRENNAARLWLQLFGPDCISDSTRDRVVRELDIALPTDGHYWKKYEKSDDDPDWKEATDRTWSAQEFPKIAAWLEDNKPQIERAIEASKLPRFYIPMLTESEGSLLMTGMVPALGRFLNAAETLQVHANLAVFESRTEESWRDLEAIHRSGNQLLQHPTVIGRLLGLAHVALCETGVRQLVVDGKLTREQLLALMEKHSELGAVGSCMPSIERNARFTLLDFAIHLKHKHAGAINIIALVDGGGIVNANTVSRVLARVSQADLSVVLKTINTSYDEMVQVIQEPDHQLRSVRLKALVEKTGESARRVKAHSLPPTEWMALVICSVLMPDFSRIPILERRVQISRELTRIAFNLQLHRVEHGKYPEALPGPTTDPYSGKPYIYRRTVDGYLLYSVGPNMKDDGGVEGTPAEGDADDVVVRAGRQ